MEFSDVIREARRLGRIVYIATTRPDGRPHNVPIGINWIDGDVFAFVSSPAVKLANIRDNPRVHLHWAVSEETNMDSLLIDADAVIIDTVAERTELWDKMGYDLSEFEPGGPESDGHVFLRITPTRATLLRRYGFAGRDTWRRSNDSSPDELVIDLREPSGQHEAQ